MIVSAALGVYLPAIMIAALSFRSYSLVIWKTLGINFLILLAFGVVGYKTGSVWRTAILYTVLGLVFTVVQMVGTEDPASYVNWWKGYFYILVAPGASAYLFNKFMKLLEC